MSDHQYVQHPVFTTRDHCEHPMDPEKDGAYGICGETKSAHLSIEEPEGICQHVSFPHPKRGYCVGWRRVRKEKPERKRWPRKIGWTKLLARRKACKHVFTKGRIVAAITFAADSCPRCLADEVAYWKGRTHSAEGQRDAMIRAAETALALTEEARSLIAAT